MGKKRKNGNARVWTTCSSAILKIIYGEKHKMLMQTQLQVIICGPQLQRQLIANVEPTINFIPFLRCVLGLLLLLLVLTCLV